ncbi:rac-beta serine threonine-protein kinase- [Stylonychia lemnae]|uniref:Rac-beta serine threonine-protein kinase n=1 Tax=Stylonychia lemnae TaxID=5949 RepID=A0A077ZTX6_STYLE|nr:rac-beta serine threonine-protein kinase- [Stylonychia lemnae]|eukprot:CDW73317.1 rac-beta serine threonine-protein kinase- [Stylonychia lemnae]
MGKSQSRPFEKQFNLSTIALQKHPPKDPQMAYESQAFNISKISITEEESNNIVINNFRDLELSQNNSNQTTVSLSDSNNKTTNRTSEVDKVKLDDFSIIKVVGRGAYVSLQYAFQNTKRVYMVFEFMEGGELYVHLKESGKFNVERTREYAAQILLALEDLKLENVLMDKDGYIKLADFGLAKINQEDQIKIKGMLEEDGQYVCGTLEYLSPEVVRNKKYDSHTDLWSLGVLMFEMLSGRGPFTDRNRKLLFHKIVHQEANVDHISNSEAQDLIRRLLTKDLKKRLKDINEIKKHKFFSKIDWKAYEHREFSPIYVPLLSGNNLDYRFFDKEFVKEALHETPVESKGNLDNYSYDPDNFKFSVISDDNFINRVK